jgi:hypothetical protein
LSAKPKLASKASEQAKQADQLAAQVDELGMLEKEFAPHEFKARRIAELRVAIRAVYAAQPADHAFEAKGAEFAVILGPKGNERSVDVVQLARLIPAKLLAAFASVTLKALEAHVSPGIAARVISAERTGARPLRILELGRPAEAKPAERAK